MGKFIIVSSLTRVRVRVSVLCLFLFLTLRDYTASFVAFTIAGSALLIATTTSSLLIIVIWLFLVGAIYTYMCMLL